MKTYDTEQVDIVIEFECPVLEIRDPFRGIRQIRDPFVAIARKGGRNVLCITDAHIHGNQLLYASLAPAGIATRCHVVFITYDAYAEDNTRCSYICRCNLRLPDANDAVMLVQYVSEEFNKAIARRSARFGRRDDIDADELMHRLRAPERSLAIN